MQLFCFFVTLFHLYAQLKVMFAFSSAFPLLLPPLASKGDLSRVRVHIIQQIDTNKRTIVMYRLTGGSLINYDFFLGHPVDAD